MLQTTRSRIVFVLALVLLLAVPPLQAAEPRRDAASLRGMLAALSPWDALSSLWSFLTPPRSDNGCEVDPSGRCLPRQVPLPSFDNGCEVDPDGRCHS